MTGFHYIAIAFLASCASSAVVAPKILHLPDYVLRCPRDSPNIDSCILKSLRSLLPHLVKGIPQLELPPIDPFKVEEALMEYHNGQIHARFGVRDYTMYGLRDLQFLQVRTNFDDINDIKMDIDVFIPKLKSDARYKLQGKFVNSDFGGKGVFNMTMSNIKSTWSISGSRQVVDGVAFMKINHVDMEPVVGDMKFYASNLFNGNEALSRTALKLINQNWKLVYRELLPFMKKDWDQMMTEFANRFFLRVPLDEIFPTSL